MDVLWAANFNYNTAQAARRLGDGLRAASEDPVLWAKFLDTLGLKPGDLVDDTRLPVPATASEAQAELDTTLAEFKKLTTENISVWDEIYSVIAGLKIAYDPDYDGIARCCGSERKITVGPRFFRTNGIPVEATDEQREYLLSLTPHQRRLFMLAHEAAHGTRTNIRILRKNPGRYRREIDPVEINATEQAIKWTRNVFKD